MLQELETKEIFELAKQYAYQYLEKIGDREVYPTAEALYDLKNFEENFPESSSSAKKVIELLERYGSPATVANAGGRYFGFVNGGSVPAGLAAKWMGDFWDQNSAMQVISPIASKLEVVVEKWLREIFDLPERTVAGFVSGSFSATFCGLVA